MRKAFYALIFLSIPIFTFAQNPASKTVDELLKAKDPNEYRARINSERFLVVDKPNGKRVKYHGGDVFRFETNEGWVFQDELVSVKDSTFFIVYFDKTSERYEQREFSINEVAIVFKRQKKKGINLGIVSGAFFAPLVYDWLIFGIAPWKNTDSYGTMAAVGGAGFLVANKNKFFNRMKINENRCQLRVLRY
ncbi:hypothetical protein SAMN06298216_3145 [Spirosomataceae bacterium TFI 002]|nr:hypothetical protein SAMN06298216_3145 [Spirosomataceae bacterium TFI 002]